MTKEQVDHRLDGIEGNIEWLREHELDENSEEAAKRIGLIKGDADALLQLVRGDRPMLRGLFADSGGESEQ